MPEAVQSYFQFCLILSTILFQAWQNGIMFSIVDSFIYGHNVFSILVLGVLPAWVLLHLNITVTSSGEAVQEPGVFQVPSIWRQKQE